MTLRQRIALHYGGLISVALLVLLWLAYHEFATERQLRKMLGARWQSEAPWGESVEPYIYALIPVILLTGWWLTRRSLQPLTTLARNVERVGVDNLREPLPRSHNGDELDRLTGAFNTMTKRLDQSFQQIREFTLHASHELKTPLTIMRGELETAMHQEAAYTPQQRECLHTLLDEVQRLAKIVDTLTLLTKADAGLIALERQPVSLAELVRESYEDGLILAEPQKLQVTLPLCEELTVAGERHRLRQLLLNLVDNAIKYNRPGGSVTMRLRQVDQTAEIEIVNTGAGLSPAMAAQVFDRFVRGDEARARAIDGCGLGLAIARWIAEAHDGSIQLSSEPGKQTTVRVRLPLAEKT